MVKSKNKAEYVQQKSAELMDQTDMIKFGAEMCRTHTNNEVL